MGRIILAVALFVSAILSGCNSSTGECSTADDCLAGWLCVDSQCRQLCHDLRDCEGANEVCEDGVCVVGVSTGECTVNEDCVAPPICHRSPGFCTDEYCQYVAAADGADCTLGGQVTGSCTSGACIECDGPSDCIGTKDYPECFAATCAAGRCDVSTNAATVCVEAGCSNGIISDQRTCGADGQCAFTGNETNCEGHICNGNTCNDDCAGSDDNCLATHFCSTDACVERANDGATCGSDNDCKSRFCDPESHICCAGGDCCATPNDCPTSYSEAVCLQPSGADATCQGALTQATCTQSVCGTVDSGDDDSSCNGVRRTCPNNLAAVTCTSAAEQPLATCPSICVTGGCESGYECESGTCVLQQGTSGPGEVCAENFDCASNICDTTCRIAENNSCTSNAHCETGFVCRGDPLSVCTTEGALGNQCDGGEDADCAAPLVCPEGVNQCKKANGTACGSANECEDAVCECADESCSTKRCANAACIDCKFVNSTGTACNGNRTRYTPCGSGGDQCDGGGNCDDGPGQICSSGVDCSSDQCRTDWDGTGTFCAQSGTHCVIDRGTDGIVQIASGSNSCGETGSDVRKRRSCSSGIWGAAACNTSCGACAAGTTSSTTSCNCGELSNDLYVCNTTTTCLMTYDETVAAGNCAGNYGCADGSPFGSECATDCELDDDCQVGYYCSGGYCYGGGWCSCSYDYVTTNQCGAWMDAECSYGDSCACVEFGPCSYN